MQFIINKLSQKTGFSGIPLVFLLGIIGFAVLAFVVAIGGIGLQAYQNLTGATPLRLGLYPDRSLEQILELYIEPPYRYNLDLEEPGKYAILTESEIQFDDISATMHEIQTDRPIEVEYLTGWFDPANEDRIPPNPLFSFEINNPGEYELSFSGRPSLGGSRLYIALDHSIGNVNIYWLAVALQTAILLTPVVLVVRRNRRRRRGAIRATTQSKRDDFSEFIKEELTKD